jgi:hypothetical protein
MRPSGLPMMMMMLLLAACLLFVLLGVAVAAPRAAESSLLLLSTAAHCSSDAAAPDARLFPALSTLGGSAFVEFSAATVGQQGSDIDAALFHDATLVGVSLGCVSNSASAPSPSLSSFVPFRPFSTSTNQNKTKQNKQSRCASLAWPTAPAQGLRGAAIPPQRLPSVLVSCGPRIAPVCSTAPSTRPSMEPVPQNQKKKKKNRSTFKSGGNIIFCPHNSLLFQGPAIFSTRYISQNRKGEMFLFPHSKWHLVFFSTNPLLVSRRAVPGAGSASGCRPVVGGVHQQPRMRG